MNLKKLPKAKVLWDLGGKFRIKYKRPTQEIVDELKKGWESKTDRELFQKLKKPKPL